MFRIVGNLLRSIPGLAMLAAPYVLVVVLYFAHFIAFKPALLVLGVLTLWRLDRIARSCAQIALNTRPKLLDDRFKYKTFSHMAPRRSQLAHLNASGKSRFALDQMRSKSFPSTDASGEYMDGKSKQ